MSTPVWFITGAGTGFGNAIAFEVLKRGHKVVATARRTAALDSLKEAGAEVLDLDVTAPEAVIATKIQQAVDFYGRLDYIINAAGYSIIGANEEASEKEVFDQFNTNVLGVAKIVKAVTPHLRAQKSGTIANFGSLASWTGGPAIGFYAASKWAVSGFSESWTAELAPFGITVTCIEPGYFRTAFLNDGKRTSTALRIKEYEDTGAQEYRNVLDQADNNQPGDVSKGAPVIVDVLTKTGVSKGRDVPVRLLLGSDCVKTVKDKCESTLSLVNEWEDVSLSTDY